MLSTIAQARSITIAWDNPTNNCDGSTLTNFEGNIVCYGTTADRFPYCIDIGNTNRVTLHHIKVNTKYYIYVHSYNSYDQIGLPSRRLKFRISP